MKRNYPLLIVIACALAFTFGVYQLFKLRFDVGDVYPPYSSLRSDPLGTMAFYESLERLNDVSTWRDFSSVNKLPDGTQTAYLHLASSHYMWERLPQDIYGEIERFLARGGRLVITLYPESFADSFRSRSFRFDEDKTNSSPKKVGSPANDKTNEPPVSVDTKEPPSTKDGDNFKDDKKVTPVRPKKKSGRRGIIDEETVRSVSIRERWGVSFQVIDLTSGEDNVYEPVPVVNKTDLPLPSTIEWHSGIVMPDPTNAWQTIYARGTNAVVIERKFGAGSVVIATDSYFLSNEALQKDRHADFLAWLVGRSRVVVFDEAHLGVIEVSGMSTLMRKYRLYWLIASLVLLAALFIWKNSVSLVPPHDDQKEGDFVPGKDASAGFINLIRRSVAPRDLLGICFAEWKKSAATTRKYSAARLQQAEALFQAEAASSERNPLGTYHSIYSALRKSSEFHRDSSKFQVPSSKEETSKDTSALKGSSKSETKRETT